MVSQEQIPESFEWVRKAGIIFCKLFKSWCGCVNDTHGYIHNRQIPRHCWRVSYVIQKLSIPLRKTLGMLLQPNWALTCLTFARIPWKKSCQETGWMRIQ